MTALRVALETQFMVGTPTGLGAYARGLRDALAARRDIELIELRDDRFDLWRFDRRVYWDQFRAPALAAAARADVVHYTGGTLPARAGRRAMLTLHDLVWLREVNRGRLYVRWYFGAFQGRLARRAHAIVVDTQAARADVADGLGIDPQRIHVGGVGIDTAYLSLERRPDDRPFALCAGTVERRKDLVTAVRAVGAVPGLRLVSAGPFTPYVDEVRAAVEQAGMTGRVDLRGYVAQSELLDLYARAAVLIFPSRYEGFGLPPLQALACGLPVVAARIPVTEEVLADCALYAPAGDVAAFAEQIRSAIGSIEVDRVARGRARASTFTWQSVADRMVPLYRALAAETR